LDVTKDESITDCVEQAFTESGSIDILINNAGFGSSDAVERR
jgi:NADP-dependent 3-hydroxy acid dehydrogenase YdfG